MKKFNIANIDWCIEPEDCDNNPQVVKEILESLPTECEVECEDEEMIAETLSDTYGYLVNSYTIAQTNSTIKEKLTKAIQLIATEESYIHNGYSLNDEDEAALAEAKDLLNEILSTIN